MKTKSLLTALCLPLAFTACTNDEFLSESPSLDARGQINVVLSAAKPQVGADTRMSIDENNKFVWEKGSDMIGAALVDGTSSLGSLDNKVLVNYPFVADQDGQSSTFSSKSSITSGHYFFYFGYQDVLNRKGLPLGMPAQVYDADNEKSSLQQAVSYMKTISPIVNLRAGVTYEDAQTYNLALKFVNLYTPVRVDIQSANIPAGVAPKVTKISLNSAAGFIQDAAADLDAIETTAGIVNLNRDFTINEAQRDAAVARLETMVMNEAIYHAKQADLATAANRGAYTLDVKGDVVLSEGETTSLYILVPKGTVTTSLTLKVNTTEGEYTKIITLANPLVLQNQIQPVSATLNFAQDGSGNVILPSTFYIANTQDWNDAIEFMTSHAIGYLNKTASFELTKDVAIDRLPIFNLKITAATPKTLTLSSNFTYTSDNKSQFDFDNVNLAVAEGATLTLNDQPINTTNPVWVQDITNYGTLVINKNLNNQIINFGTMNVNSSVTLSAALTNGQAYNGATSPVTPEYVGTINIARGKQLTLGANSNNVVGTINVAAESKLNLGATTLTNDDAIVNNGTLIATAAIVNNGTIDNYGKLEAPVTNTGGRVTVESNSGAKGASSTITGGTVMIVNVSNFKSRQTDLNLTAEKYIFATARVTTEVSNVAEYINADDRATGITDITMVGGDWTLAAAFGASTSKTIEVPSNADGLTLKGANLNLQIDLPKDLGVSGTANVSAGVAVKIVGNLFVDNGANLTVGNNVSIEETGTTINATINGNTTLQPGASMKFNVATVGRGATLTVMGQSASAGAAVFGAKTTFTNAGTVISAAATVSGGAAGKVSQPTNTATGTFRGNADTITFP